MKNTHTLPIISDRGSLKMSSPVSSGATFRLRDIVKGFSDNALQDIFANMGAMELTRWCSIWCDFCGFWAEKRVKGKMPFEDIKTMFKRFWDILWKARTITYWATDPLDWEEWDRDYEHVLDVVQEYAGYKPFVSTAVPRGKEPLMLRLLLAGKLERVSVSHMNFHRLRKFFMEQYPQLATFDFEIIETEFGKQVTFSGNPNKYWDEAWLQLILQLRKESWDGTQYIFTRDGSKEEETLLQLWSKKISEDKSGIACFHGTLLRWDGFYNSTVVPVSPDFLYGVKNDRINTTTMRVNHLWQDIMAIFGGVPQEGYWEYIRKVPLHPWAVTPFDMEEMRGYTWDIALFQKILPVQAVLLSVYEECGWDMRKLCHDIRLLRAKMVAEMKLEMLGKRLGNAVEHIESTNPYLRRYRAIQAQIEVEKKKIFPYKK